MIRSGFLNRRVFKEFQSLPQDMQAEFFHILELMDTLGSHQIGLPHTRKLDKELWEIRLKGKDGIARAIYVTETSSTITILHVFIKKTQKTPQQAITLAKKRMKEI